jgi:anti-sigma B factor antagonist
MKISQRSVNGVCVLELDGPITLGAEGSDRLNEAIRGLTTSGERKIVLNLASVPYMDSAGLGAIVNAYTTVRKQEGDLKLAAVTKKLSDLLVITKLATVFESYDTETAAVEAFGV